TVLAALLLALGPAHASALRLDVGAVEHADFALRGLTLEVSDDGDLELRVARLEVAGQAWSDVTVSCSAFRAELPRIECADGQLRAAPLEEPLPLSFLHDLVSGETVFGFMQAPIGPFAALGPELAALSPQGRLDGRVRFAPDGRTSFTGELSAGGFASADGLQAADGLSIGLGGELWPDGAARRFSAGLEWRG